STDTTSTTTKPQGPITQNNNPTGSSPSPSNIPSAPQINDTTAPLPSHTPHLNAIAQKWKEDPTHDFGTFTGRNIYNALYHGELDERRLHRLKIGFWRLLEQLNGRGEWDGGAGG
ncbi:MAG: hypothetical protein Q9180_008983, partial [Flavoplaca navasiana]